MKTCDKCMKHDICGKREVFGAVGCVDDFQQKPQTNADKIRSVSDEELAEFLTRITNDAQLNVGAKCNYQWDEWLQNEVENGN